MHQPRSRREWIRGSAAAAAGAALSPGLLLSCDAAGRERSAGAAEAVAQTGRGDAQPAACGRFIDVRELGATPGGDLREPLQRAADAAAREGRPVLIPAGVWTFRSKDARGRFITPRGDVTFRGEPGATVLTAANGLQDWDGFRLDRPATLHFEDLIFDGNAAGNLVPAGRIQLQSWIYLDTCEQLVVRRVHFRNHAGARCISVGNGVAGRPRGARAVVLEQVTAHNVGSAAPGNERLADHSTFWINADSCSIRECAVQNDRMGVNDTFIENHSSNSVVMANRCRNVRLGIIAAALFNQQTSSVYANNVMEEVQSGYRFCAENGQRLAVLVQGGDIRQVDDIHPVFDAGYCATPAESIALQQVRAENVAARPSAGAGHAFAIGRVRSFEVDGAALRGIPGRVAHLDWRWRPAGGEVGIRLADVHALDCGRARAAGTPADGVALHEPSGPPLRHCVIERCTFENTTRGGPMRRAVSGDVPIAGHLVIRGNRFAGVDPGCAWAAAAAVARIELDVEDTFHGSGSDPNAGGGLGVRASPGSRWVDAASGHAYEKRTERTNADATGWVKTAIVTDERPPATGTWRVGDRAINQPAGGRARTVHGPPGGRYVIESWEAYHDASPPDPANAAATFAERRQYTGG